MLQYILISLRAQPFWTWVIQSLLDLFEAAELITYTSYNKTW